MQIREQGRQIQCIRSTYEKEKGRSRQRVVATLKRWETALPAEGIGELTEAERQELAAWLAERQEKSQADSRGYAVVTAAGSINRIAAAISAGVEATPEQAAATWKALAELAKALRKAGHPKPKPDPKPSEKVAVAPNAPPASQLATALTGEKPSKRVRAAKPKPVARVAALKPAKTVVGPVTRHPAAPAPDGKQEKAGEGTKKEGGKQ